MWWNGASFVLEELDLELTLTEISNTCVMLHASVLKNIITPVDSERVFAYQLPSYPETVTLLSIPQRLGMYRGSITVWQFNN